MKMNKKISKTLALAADRMHEKVTELGLKGENIMNLKNWINRLVFAAWSTTVILVVAPSAFAQESYSVQASESKSLSGQIRWPKSYGRDPRKLKENNNPCPSFTVQALDPETGVKVTAKGSDGGERDDYYFCRYEMMVPTNRRLTMSGRLTDRAYSAYAPEDFTKPKWYVTPSAKYVTLDKKAMWLTFQLKYFAGPMR
jgi:hypothetical protein